MADESSQTVTTLETLFSLEHFGINLFRVFIFLSSPSKILWQFQNDFFF